MEDQGGRSQFAVGSQFKENSRNSNEAGAAVSEAIEGRRRRRLEGCQGVRGLRSAVHLKTTSTLSRIRFRVSYLRRATKQ
jgi:hypothetical protein